MSQVTDRTVGANPSGFDMRTELNNIIGALETCNSGASEPLNTVAFMDWFDTSNATYYYLKKRNHDNTAWNTVLRYTVATKLVEFGANALTATQLATARNINGISFNGTANIEIEDKLGTAIASAATTTIGTVGLGNYIHITGTTTITSFGTAGRVGIRRTLIFDGALTITHNNTSLICLGAANIVTVAGTIIEVVAETTANWRVLNISHPAVSMTEIGYLDGVTSAIQAQINNAVKKTGDETIAGVKTFMDNVGIGDVPSLWSSAFKALDIKNASFYQYNDNYAGMSHNQYFNGSNYIYIENGTAYDFTFGANDGFFWRTAPSGIAGNPITWTTAMTLGASGKLSLTGVSNASDYEQVRFNKLNGTANTIFYGIDGVASTSIFSGMTIGKHVANSRSINATGTINASGADYAEYEQNNGIAFSKGQIVGFKADGTLTNKYNEAIRFAIKSTNPSYVGGDTWGNEDIVGKRPEQPVKKEEQTDEEFVEIEEQYKAELVVFETKLEVERQKVDRVAYSGKVPVNIIGAIPGQYICVKNNNDSIGFELITSPSFEQYLTCVGRVNKILEDGRAEVAVIIH